MTSKDQWLTSRGVARFLHGRRDNDIKVEVNGILVPIGRIYYSSIADSYVLELAEGLDLRVALTTDDPPDDVDRGGRGE